MDLGLAGRRALVTGGTKGIGRATAELLAAEGAAVALCARDAGEVAEAGAALRARGVPATGPVALRRHHSVGSPAAMALDVADGDALRDWVGDALSPFGDITPWDRPLRGRWRELGGLDVVVANVSALAVGGDEAAWRAGFDVDMMHSVRAAEAAMPFLEASDAGLIVLVSSVSGREIDFAAGPYGAFKAALVHYAQGLAHRLAPKGIRANAVSPGNTYFEGGVWARIERDDPALYASALALNPTGRMGTPEEVACAVVFLASPAASFVSGTNLVVDGALTRGVQL